HGSRHSKSDATAIPARRATAHSETRTQVMRSFLSTAQHTLDMTDEAACDAVLCVLVGNTTPWFAVSHNSNFPTHGNRGAAAGGGHLARLSKRPSARPELRYGRRMNRPVVGCDPRVRKTFKGVVKAAVVLLRCRRPDKSCSARDPEARQRAATNRPGAE